MTLRYRAEELKLPSGVTPENLDWVVFSWDLALIDSSSNKFYQIVLAPGLLQIRYGTRSLKTFKAATGRVDKWAEMSPFGMAFATKKSREKLTKGYEWVCTPFALDLATVNIPGGRKTLKDKYETYPVETAGDLLNRDDTIIKQDFYTLLHSYRDSHRAEYEAQPTNPSLWEGR